MTDPVTLEQLEQLDADIAAALLNVQHHLAELGYARVRLEVLRAEQYRAVDAYNRQAARPLTP